MLSAAQAAQKTRPIAQIDGDTLSAAQAAQKSSWLCSSSW